MSIQRYFADDGGYGCNLINAPDGDLVLYHAHAAEVARLTGERDAYRTVLESAGYRQLDDLPSKGLDNARAVGKAAADITIKIKAERDDLEQRIDIAEHDSKKAWSALDLIAWHIHRRPAGECGHSELPQMVYDLMQERDAAVAAKERAIALLDELHSIVDGECPWLLDDDKDGYGDLGVQIEELLAAAQDAKPRTPLLDQLSTGPWPTFVEEVKTAAAERTACRALSPEPWAGAEGGGNSMGACECYDAEPIIVLKNKVVNARKKHQCDECGATIHVGIDYHYMTGVCDGEMITHHTCLFCHRVYRDLQGMGYCVLTGGLWELVEEIERGDA